jgi:hypothetical protein
MHKKKKKQNEATPRRKNAGCGGGQGLRPRQGQHWAIPEKMRLAKARLKICANSESSPPMPILLKLKSLLKMLGCLFPLAPALRPVSFTRAAPARSITSDELPAKNCPRPIS